MPLSSEDREVACACRREGQKGQTVWTSEPQRKLRPLGEALFKKKYKIRDFLGGPLVKNVPCNAGDVGSIPGAGTKIPQASGQLLSPEPGHDN